MRKVVLLLLVAIAVSNGYTLPTDAFMMPFAPTSVAFSPRDGQLHNIEMMAQQNDWRIRRVTKVLDIYMVSFAPASDLHNLSAAMKSGDTETINMLWSPIARKVWSIVGELEKSQWVRWACPNYYYYAQDYTPDDPFCVNSTHLGLADPPNQFGLYLMHAPTAWDFTTGEPDILLAIVDSGVDVDHPDLAENIYVNPGEDIDGDGVLYDTDDLNGIDDDGDGYVDDLFGYDFVGGNTGDASDDSTEEDWNPDIHYSGDDGWGEPDPSCGDGVASSIWIPADGGVGHGTHCAGIAAAVMDNDTLFAGAAGHCSILPVRVMNAEGQGMMTDIVSGIEYAVLAGANVISLSLGGFGGSDPGMASAIAMAHNADIPIIAASGNMGFIPGAGVSYPGSDSLTLAVGSTTSGLERSSFSQYGPELDVMATGGDATMMGEMNEVIWSTYVLSVATADSLGVTPGMHSIAGEAGTSMATPFVAGLAGLILSANPDLSVDSVYAIIRNTATDMGTAGRDDETGYGVVNFGEAVRVAAEAVAESPKVPESIGFSVFPNPTNPAMTFSFVGAAVSLALMDIQGRTVLKRDIAAGEHQITVQTSDIPSGVYLAVVQYDNRTIMKKVSIMR